MIPEREPSTRDSHLIKGFSLLEVVVSLSIFVVLMVGITQALISTRNFVGEDQLRNDLELESLRLTREFTADLGNAAWFQNPPGESFPNQANPMTDSPVTFPNVGKGTTNQGTTAWGDQLDFVKLRMKEGTWNSAQETRYGSTSARLNLTSTSAVSMTSIFEAPTMVSLVSNPDWVPGSPKTTPFVWPVFEAAVAPLTFTENNSFNTAGRSPRLYRYIVRAAPGSLRNGRLVRQYSNGPGPNYSAIPEYSQQITGTGGMVVPPAVTTGVNPWVDDVVLTDNVKATDDPDYPDLVGTPGIRFDTFLTDPSVKNNEIRIRLILVRIPDTDHAGVRLRRVIQTSVAMRSVTY